MRSRALIAAALAVAAAASVPARQSAPPTGAPQAAATKTPRLQIWQVDLIPTGTGFAVTEPRLEGDAWVFQVWPERDTVRVPKAKIKKITPRSRQIKDEVLYRIELAPTGTMIARDQPRLKGSTYTFHAWKGGALMSLRQSDVKSVARLSEADVFAVHLERFGLKPIANLPMEGGTATIVPAPGAPAAGDSDAGQGVHNWIYEGTPGTDDAWAPPSATVAYPGDVPKAAEPH